MSKNLSTTFDYNYDPPTEDVFSINIDGAPSKFGEGKRLQLLRIGLRGRVIPSEHRKDANLTFVIDVSGSMEKENRLELVKKALTLLVDQLRPTDKVGIVVLWFSWQTRTSTHRLNAT